ncbi:hypothetical protein H4R33_002214 [Dimargaris cristalligena]|uniref:Uncharacterized protein n=1 Tax=Dimargaris cristalligena TaxID=215637 RepID=A0A4P9ZRU2_9FUNG|nr:hypothetical protein H4R33_002214 [Dimargaris cristalligena]RKP35481.1 hypothetical protein BJ085DRAFT_29475 [Dimargaris cristalligena]|eukprot:RKP35481.1 hypothetical protein BJ085DRAFT_29475 [Dimargaris cristalligena]
MYRSHSHNQNNSAHDRSPTEYRSGRGRGRSGSMHNSPSRPAPAGPMAPSTNDNYRHPRQPLPTNPANSSMAGRDRSPRRGHGLHPSRSPNRSEHPPHRQSLGNGPGAGPPGPYARRPQLPGGPLPPSQGHRPTGLANPMLSRHPGGPHRPTPLGRVEYTGLASQNPGPFSPPIRSPPIESSKAHLNILRKHNEETALRQEASQLLNQAQATTPGTYVSVLSRNNNQIIPVLPRLTKGELGH